MCEDKVQRSISRNMATAETVPRPCRFNGGCEDLLSSTVPGLDLIYMLTELSLGKGSEVSEELMCMNSKEGRSLKFG